MACLNLKINSRNINIQIFLKLLKEHKTQTKYAIQLTNLQKPEIVNKDSKPKQTHPSMNSNQINILLVNLKVPSINQFNNSNDFVSFLNTSPKPPCNFKLSKDVVTQTLQNNSCPDIYGLSCFLFM